MAIFHETTLYRASGGGAQSGPRPGAAERSEANPVWVSVAKWQHQANIATSPSATPVSVLQDPSSPPDPPRVLRRHVDPHKYLMSDH